MTRLVQRREQGREAGTCWGEQREMWVSWESSTCKEGMQKRGWRDRNEEVGQDQVEYAIIFDLKTLKAFKTCKKLFSPQMFTVYYFLRGRKGASHVNMKEEFQDKCPLRFVWSVLGRKEMAVFKTKISVCNKNIFFFFLLLLYIMILRNGHFFLRSVLRISLFYNVWGVQLLHHFYFNGMSKGLTVT